jgi:ABC-2 type transport system ATP-binding protein
MAEVDYLADRVGLLVDGGIEAVDTVPNLVDTYAGAVRLVVGPPTEPAVDRTDALESTLEASASRVHRTDDGELIGVFDSRQRAQDAYGDLHDHGTGRSIDLVSPGMEDVFLEVAGTPLGPSGELR